MRVGADDRSTQATAAERSRGEAQSCLWDALTAHFQDHNENVDVRVRDLTEDARTSLPAHISHPKVNQCYILQSMGCVKSKRSDSAALNANSTEVEGKAKGSRGEKAYLVHSEMGSTESSPQVNPVLLEYAQKLSEEIVARAVQQWVEVDRRYSDIPYIECDVP